MTLFNIFYEHDGGGTDWCAVRTTDALEAERLFRDKYDGRRILRIEVDRKVSGGQPEGWN